MLKEIIGIQFKIHGLGLPCLFLSHSPHFGDFNFRELRKLKSHSLATFVNLTSDGNGTGSDMRGLNMWVI